MCSNTPEFKVRKITAKIGVEGFGGRSLNCRSSGQLSQERKQLMMYSLKSSLKPPSESGASVSLLSNKCSTVMKNAKSICSKELALSKSNLAI
jgi:hypothetical protein